METNDWLALQLADDQLGAHLLCAPLKPVPDLRRYDAKRLSGAETI